jgi:hypothetical protein
VCHSQADKIVPQTENDCGLDARRGARARISGRLELPHVLLTPSGGLVQNLAAAAGAAASPLLNILQDLTLDTAAGPPFIRHNALSMYREPVSCL